jgi:hypothetical protein
VCVCVCVCVCECESESECASGSVEVEEEVQFSVSREGRALCKFMASAERPNSWPAVGVHCRFVRLGNRG